MLDGAARVGDLMKAVAEQGMPAIAVTDHGNNFGAYDFWKQATEAGIKPIIGTEAYVTPGTHRSDKTRVRWGNGGEDDVSGSGAYTHMTLLAETTEGMHNLFRLSSLASMEGYYFKPRMDRELLRDLLDGPHRHDGMRERRGADPAAPRPVRRGASRPPPSTATCSARTTTSPRSWITGSASSAASCPTCCGSRKTSALPLVATNDLHYTHAARLERPRDPALRAVGVDPRRPEPVQVRRERVLPEDARADAAAVLRPPGGLRQHPAHRRALQRRVRHDRQLHAALPGPRGRDRGQLVREGGREAASLERYPNGIPDAGAHAGGLRDPGHQRRWASRATSSIVADFISWATDATASGSGPDVVRAPARWPPTRCGSPTSTRCGTGSSSSASSTPTASRCPTSTSTSTSAGAARSSTTSPRSTARSASPRSSPTARSRPSRR